MNKEQQKVFSLLIEIDEICRKNGITYYLSPTLTLKAVLGQPFPQNPLAGCVFMKTEDMEKFRQVFESSGSGERALESMCSHKFFPGFYMRYEDLNTTCYCLHAGKNFKYHGMGVNIRPLRGGPDSEKKQKLLEILETGWQETCYNCGEEWKFSHMMWGIFMRILCLTGRERVGKKLYALFLRTGKNPREGKYVVKNSRTDLRTYPAEIFQGTAEAALEGYSFLVPAMYKKYLKIVFGENYARISPASYKNNFSVITSAEVGCGEFLREIGPQEKFLKARRRQFLRDLPVRRVRSRFESAWDHISLYGAGSELKTGLRRKRQFIQNLYKCRDYARLETVFRPYTRWIRHCMEKGEFYGLDPDIMEIYLNYLRETSRGELAEKIVGMSGRR